jgi:hypothetical protein
MMPGLSPIDMTRLGPMVASNFLPNERLLRICREDPKGMLQRQALRFLVPVVLFLFLFSLRGSQLTLTAIMFFTFALVLFFLVLYKLRSRTAFAFTDQRILILSLPGGQIKGWINLDKMSTVEIENRGDYVGDIRIRFSGRPSGARRSPKGTATTPFQELPIEDFALKGIEQPEELKAVLDSLPRRF